MDDLEKRGLIAVALSLGFLFLWMSFFAPAPPKAPAEPAAPAEVSREPEATEPPAAALEAPTEVEAVMAQAEEEIVLRTDLYEITLTNRGGRVLSWKLLAYTSPGGDTVELVPPESRALGRLPLSLWVDGRDDLIERADEGLYQVEQSTLPDGRHRLHLAYSEASGFQVEKTLVVAADSYFVEADVSMIEGGRRMPAWLTWGAGFGETAEGDVAATRFLQSGGAIVDRGGTVTRYRKEKQDTPVVLDGGVEIDWAGMETTYFGALMIPGGVSRQAVLLPASFQPPTPAGEDEPPKPVPYLSLALSPGDEVGPETPDYTIFVGPKDYRLLRDSGHNLQRAINFGWPVIREIAQGLYLALTWVYGYVGNYGVAILILTFVIRLGFFPLIYRTQIKMRQMQVKTKRIQPKMKAIKERYAELRRKKKGNDFELRQKMNEEIMALYRKEGVNPLGGLGGCLPLLIQLPFLYGFYQLLYSTIELRQAPFFGWIQDLSHPDPYYVTPLLMGGSMLLQTKISMSSAVDPNQRRMMTMMSLVFTVFFLNLPSGLVLYWLFSNVLGIGQQVLVNRRADQESEAQKPQNRKKSSRKGDPDGEKPKKARAVSRP